VRLQVNPGPDLYLDYFMQRDILGDNAITPAIEPSIPAELGVMINNKGAGAAYGVDLESSQPVIIDNEKGLLVDFRIIGSNLGGHPRHLGLYDVIFGNIGAGKTAVGQWWFTSSLLGHFVSYSASVNHLDSYGNRDLSLVSSVKIHELIHGIMAYGALYDTIGDFLVNEIPDGNDTPDHIFFSNGTDTDVSLAKNVWIDNPVTIWDTTVHLTVEPKIPGWNYTKINDPGAGLYRIASVIRNDGQVIPLENMWLTYCTIPDGADPIYEDKLHFTDLFTSFDTIGYNVVFEPVDQDPPAVDSILGIPDAATEIPVDSVDIRFSEPIVDTTFTFADMTLCCQGGPNLMDSSMVIMKISDTVYRVFFGGSTIMNGYYTLIVQASGVSDFSGNFGKEGKMVGWIQASSVPAISQFIGLPVTPGAPIDSLLILFNMPVYDSTFTVDDLELIKNQIDTLSVSSLIITPADPDHLLFRITGLSQETGADGNYKLNVMVTSIYARNGQHGLTDQAASWSVCQTAPPTAFAGNNDTTCSNMLYQLSGNVTNASSFSWSSTGSGTFYNSGSLTPTYQPSTADISAGSVMITLSAFASGNCAASAVSLFRLVIVKAPYAYAGNSVTLMSGEPYLLSGSVALNTSSITWTTSGTGQFSDDHILHPVYTPAPADTGTVTLTLTVAGYYSCEPVSSFLTINYLPPAYPVIQASGLVFSNPDTAKITLNWNDGNGMKRSVFMKQDTAGYPIPEMTGNYVGNPLFGAGSQINSSGWFCIFDGTTHLQGVVVTGLQPGMTYRLMVCEYNEYFGMRYYQQQGASQNPLNRQVCPISIPQISGETTGCAGNALNFSTETGMNEYSWSLLPDGLINSGSGTASILAVWNTSGNKSLKVSYHLPNGCPSSWKHHLVIINPLPSGAGVIQGPGSVCAGVAGIMYSIPAINNAQSYQWTVPAGCTIIQGQGSASVTVNFPVNLLTDVISVTGMNACGAGISSSLQVSVYAPLTGLVNLQGITVHAGENFCYTGAKITTAGTGTIYVIQNGGQATMIAADTVRLRSGTKVSSGGKLLASVTQNCIPCNTSKSVVFVSGQPESTAETMNQAERLMPFFRAYPNPVSDDLTVELLDQRVLSSVVHIQILNLLGDKIYQTEMIAEFRKKISLQGWNAGVYLLRVSDGAQSGIMKVVR
jgi:hypothetical protein